MTPAAGKHLWCTRATGDLFLQQSQVLQRVTRRNQGRNEVRWSPGQEASLAAPMFEPEIIRKQIYCIEESTCDTVVAFRRHPQWFGARAIVPLSLRRPCPQPHSLLDSKIEKSFVYAVVLVSARSLVIALIIIYRTQLARWCDAPSSRRFRHASRHRISRKDSRRERASMSAGIGHCMLLRESRLRNAWWEPDPVNCVFRRFSSLFAHPVFVN